MKGILSSPKLTTKSFTNVRHNAIKLELANGNSISTIWGYGTYSDNYNLPEEDGPEEISNLFNKFRKSNTVEIAIRCPQELHDKIMKKYTGITEESVIGNLTITEWLKILNRLNK